MSEIAKSANLGSDKMSLSAVTLLLLGQMDLLNQSLIMSAVVHGEIYHGNHFNCIGKLEKTYAGICSFPKIQAYFRLGVGKIGRAFN